MAAGRDWPLRHLLLLLLLATASSTAGVVYQGPRFVSEPPGLVRFTNSSGLQLDCRGSGTPPVDVHWTLVSGEPVSYVPGVRESLSNGSLLFAPFPARLFRQDVHGGRYRCVVSNSLGTIISRTVRLKPVVLQSYHVTAMDGTSPLGQTALLTCHVPDHVRATVQVISWSVGGGHNVYPTLLGDEKYHMLPSGELLVRDVSGGDVTRRFLCRTVHLMTDQHVISQQPAKIVVREPEPDRGRPRIAGSSSALRVRAGEDAVLFCVAQSGEDTPPRTSWSRDSAGRNASPVPVPVAGDGDVTVAGHVLVIRSARQRHAGWYRCRADTATGHVTAKLHLQVQVTPSVSVSPARVMVNRGEPFRLSCWAPQPAELHWLKDGLRLDPGRQLTIRQERSGDRVMSRLEGGDMKLATQGMYQCFASTQLDSAQAAAQVLLGDSHPVLLDKFINHTVQPFSSVSLRCVANASPTPQITWLLDGYPLTPDHRRLIGQYVSASNDVISHVNMSAVRPVDGGWVTCRASNRFGSTGHTARLNIYGEPQVREMPEVLAVAGEPLMLTCSVGGYPILEISWEREGRPLPDGRQQHLLSNGSLLLERVEKGTSGGRYSCTGHGPGRTSSSGHLTVTVIVPPAIRPFLLGNYSVGERVQVLCFIQSGDGPLTLTWLRDGRPLSDPEVIQRSTDRFSSSLSIEKVAVRHAGNYTCRAANAARASSYTAELRVNVPPRWLLEPEDLAVRLGSAVLLHCSAEGSPPPSVTWTKTDTAGGPVPVSSLPGVVLHPNGSLSVPAAATQHRGLYTCRASNGVGPPLTARPQLTVYAAPSFAERSRAERYREGQNVTLTCDPDGDEPLSLLWFREGQPVQDSFRLLVRQWTDPANSSRSSLSLLRAVAADSGRYSCRASNDRGAASLVIHLEIEETPLPPSRVQVVEVLSRSVTVEWQQPDKVSRHLTGYRLQYKQASGDWDSAVTAVLSGRRVRLAGLLPATDYTLRPVAITTLGAGPPGRPVHVRTEQAPPSLAPADLSLVPLTSTEVKVTWRPPPAGSHHGQLTGYRVIYGRANTSDGAGSHRAELNTTALAVSLRSLRPFSVYRVMVEACNGRGCGPRSPAGLVRTLEDVPSAAPVRPQCVTLGARQLGLSWGPPPAGLTNGNLRGYKVKTEATEERDGQLFYSVSDVTEAGVTVQELSPHVNYSLRVAAVTGVGAGLYSPAVFCTTKQDVPSEPAAVSVAVKSMDSVLLSWLPPEHTNGQLTSYSIYIRTVSPTAAASEERVSVPAGTTVYPLSGLSRRRDYAVRVTGHTTAGEGQPSRPVRFTTDLGDTVPVQLVSLSRPVTADEGDSLTLTCRHVGSPPLSLTWYRDGQPLKNPRFSRQPDGSLQLGHVVRDDDGNYTCQVSSEESSGDVTYAVTVLGVPPAPSLTVSGTASDSVTVRWSSGDPHGLVIRGYRLQYWSDQRRPAEVGLERFVREYTLTGLSCGTAYQLQLRAFNRLGASEPSAVVRARTSGRPPALADPDRLVAANDTEVTVRLDLWTAAECPVSRFVIRWRPAESRETMSVDLSGATRQHVIRRLLPAAAYVINVTAVSPAGATSHAADVITRGTVDVGASSGPADLSPGQAPFSLRVVVPVLASLLSLLMIVSAAYLCVRKRRRKVPLYLPEPTGYSRTGKGVEPPTLPPPPPLAPPSGDLLKQEELCPYATLYRSVAAAGGGRGMTELTAAGHCASLPTALASSDLAGGLEPLYADPRQRLQSLPHTGFHQRQRVRSLPVSDEYDSPDSDSDSAGRPGQVRSASLRRGHRSHSRDPRVVADSSSSSGHLSPELRSRSLSSRRARRKRRRARTPVLLPPAGELARRGRSAAELQGLLLQQLQLQQQLAAHRAATEPADQTDLDPRTLADQNDLDLRTLAHTLKGRDFSINV